MHGATSNGYTTFVNAAICDHKLRIDHGPIIFDIPVPYGHSKTESEQSISDTTSSVPSEEDSDSGST
uniref:Uncharacterized protein n=2 Tax=Panagrolaimus TaxID=55784 RepID=A0A914P9D5_9BILA